MRVIIQRVKNAQVIIDKSEERTVESGLLVFLGIEAADNASDVEWLVNKVLNLRIFNDENGENITLVYPFKSFTRFNEDNGLPKNFQKEYEKINGLGSFRRDIWDVLSEYSDGNSDEVLQLIN